MKEVTINNYRKDKYYMRVVCAVTKILSRSDTVAPVDVLMEMGNLSKKNRILRFSKSGNHKLEEAYSLHYIWNQAQKKNEKSFQTTNSEGIK